MNYFWQKQINNFILFYKSWVHYWFHNHITLVGEEDEQCKIGHTWGVFSHVLILSNIVNATVEHVEVFT